MFFAAGIFALVYGGLLALQTRFLGDYDEKYRGRAKQTRDARRRERYEQHRAEERKAHQQWLEKKRAAKRAKRERKRDEDERLARGEFVRARRQRRSVYGVESRNAWKGVDGR
nr:hypothetical protein CFP56_43901 [Quercus suber]